MQRTGCHNSANADNEKHQRSLGNLTDVLMTTGSTAPTSVVNVGQHFKDAAECRSRTRTMLSGAESDQIFEFGNTPQNFVGHIREGTYWRFGVQDVGGENKANKNEVLLGRNDS